MIFGYPSEAISENWLNDCLIEMIKDIHDAILHGVEISNWPNSIPENFREGLQSRTGIRDRLDIYYSTVLTLTHEDIYRLEEALINQNRIEDLLTNDCNCEKISDLPEEIRDPIKNLFEFAFDKLTDLGLRDSLFERIYQSAYDVCPFCGCEYFSAPGGPREALDHYIPKSIYPFAGANLQNLVPMGHKCNSSYKQTTDVLYQDDGTRRRNFYPYSGNHNGIRISLEESEPFEGDQAPFPLPHWQISFDPNNEEVSTWEAIFSIQERYERDILNPKFSSWLTSFSVWFKHSGHNIVNDEDIISALEHFIAYLESMGLNDRAFLKAAVFKMLLHHYRQGNQRLIDFLTDLVGAN